MIVAAAWLVEDVKAAELSYNQPSQSVIADLQLDPGPDARDGDPSSISLGPLQGVLGDNSTSAVAMGESSVPLLQNAFTVQAAMLSASGESAGSGNYTAQAQLNSGNFSGTFDDGPWQIDVNPEPGEDPTHFAEIQIQVSVAGSLQTNGDQQQASVAWFVATDQGTIVDGSAQSNTGGEQPFSDSVCAKIVVPLGSSFMLDFSFATSVAGDSTGPSMGGDADATFTEALIQVTSTTVDIPQAMTLLAQNRRVRADAWGTDPAFTEDIGEAVAPDFGPFDEIVDAEVNVTGSDGDGESQQTSSITTTQIIASGSCDAQASTFTMGSTAAGRGRSTFRVSFLLDAEFAYSMNAHLTTTGGPGPQSGAQATLTLTTTSGNEFSEFLTGEQDENFLFEGTLMPGNWTLLIEAFAFANSDEDNSFGSGTATYDATLTLNQIADTTCCEPADTDCSGDVDILDVAPFVAKLLGNGSGCSPCEADMNRDGTADGLDIEPFVKVLLDCVVQGGPCCDPSDADCNGTVDLLDVPPFVDALLNGGTGCSPCQGDANEDGTVDGDDVQAFVLDLLGG